MLSGLWVKAVAALTLLASILLAVIGYQSKENKRKQNIIDTHEKKDEIADEVNQAEQKADEQAKSDKADINTDDWRDNI